MQLFMLYKATQTVIEKAPIDAVTGNLESKEVKWFNAIAGEEGSWLYVLNIYFEFPRIHKLFFGKNHVEITKFVYIYGSFRVYRKATKQSLR
jgi:hypothetical protein